MYKQPCENMFARRRKKKEVDITQYNWKKGPVACKGHRGVNIQREKHTSIIDFIIRWCGPTGAILLKSNLIRVEVFGTMDAWPMVVQNFGQISWVSQT